MIDRLLVEEVEGEALFAEVWPTGGGRYISVQLGEFIPGRNYPLHFDSASQGITRMRIERGYAEDNCQPMREATVRRIISHLEAYEETQR